MELKLTNQVNSYYKKQFMLSAYVALDSWVCKFDSRAQLELHFSQLVSVGILETFLHS